MQRAGRAASRAVIERFQLCLDLLADSRRDFPLDAGPERIDLGSPVIPRLGPPGVIELQEMLDDILDETLNGMQLGSAQVLDLLREMLDVEAVVALEMRAQRLRLLLGPGVEILVVQLGCLGCHGHPHSSIATGSSTKRLNAASSSAPVAPSTTR
jgi:hypothetical protein